LSNALLFLSRSDQESVSWEPYSLNLGDLLRVISEQIEPLAQEKNLRFERDIPAILPTFGDTDHLIRLFLNLLDNAVKYTPHGGQIILRAYPSQAGVQVTIHNSGPGIPAEHLPHLFERFYRVESDRSSQSGGTGLGLAIAQEIVRRHGGEINVSSEPQQGVIVVVYLPQS
jgi:signal transduction histidine kinase